MLPFNVREIFLSDHDDVIIADVDLHPGGKKPSRNTEVYPATFFQKMDGSAKLIQKLLPCCLKCLSWLCSKGLGKNNVVEG